MNTLQKLLTYAYWLEPIPGRPASLRLLYYAVAVATACSLAYVLRRLRASVAESRPFLWASALLGGAGLALIACAVAGVPLLSMRLLVFGANGLAILCAVWLWLTQREPVDVMRRHALALSGQIDWVSNPLPLPMSLLLLAVHSGGLLAWCVERRWPLTAVPVLLALLLSPQLLSSFRARCFHLRLEALAPLLLLYAVLLLRVLALATAKLLLDFPHFYVPQPWDGVLRVDVAALVAVPWTVLLQLYAQLRSQKRSHVLVSGLGAAVVALSLLWSTYTYLHLCTHGVTGSDPYCYAQMAVDVVANGTPVHDFPWVKTMQGLGVFAEAGVHLGYHLPFEGDRAATVWPIGQSLLLAVGYALGGEGGLYAATPILGLGSALALAVLSWQLTAGHARNERWMVAGVAVFLLGTSYAQMERIVVPMADAAAQLFTTLAVVLWIHVLRSPRRYAWAALAGLAFAAAYWVRHTQLVLGLAVLAVTVFQPIGKRQKVALLSAFGLAALLAALPDLAYHRWVMGHWLRPESLELRHFGWGFMGRTLLQMVLELLSAREFLYVAPLTVYGALQQWRLRREQFVLLGSWVAAILLVHLPYEALRLRDLLSIFPVLCWWTGYGAARLWAVTESVLRRARVLQRSEFLRGLAYGALLVALLLGRAGKTLSLALASDIDTFGHLNAYQRAAFGRIGRDTEPQALIGASLNSGAVELHSGRAAFRPSVWQPDELYAFVDHMLVQGRAVYLLQDGLDMRPTLLAARERYTLQWVGRYDIPFYYTGGGSSGGLVSLWRLNPSIAARRPQ